MSAEPVLPELDEVPADLTEEADTLPPRQRRLFRQAKARTTPVEGLHMPIGLQLLHWFIIANLLGECFYAGWQVFIVMQPEGVVGPMFGAASQLPFETMMIRRAYAVEGWLAIGALSVYIGMTEILPRQLKRFRDGM